MPRPRKDRSEFDPLDNRGNSATDDLHAVYRGDSWNGIGNPADDNDDDQEGD